LQDAFTKTIPIWCSVLNTAIQQHRQANPAAHKHRVNVLSSCDSNKLCCQLHTTENCTKVCCQDGMSVQQYGQLHLRLESRNAAQTDFESDLEQCLDFSTPLWKLATGINEATNSTLQEPQPDSEWDTNLHVPPWITSAEKSLIMPQISNWAQEFLSTCQNSLPETLTSLGKPLRPLWVSQRSSMRFRSRLCTSCLHLCHCCITGR
jgi:hypothetical protein